MRAVIASYHVCIGEVIGRYQGMIARYMGDGVLAYFGYPRAQEDDAEQAVRAALALVDAVANLRTTVNAALQVRIGIATGTVVVSELLIDETPAERAVIGETPNLAARLQALAEPGAAQQIEQYLPQPHGVHGEDAQVLLGVDNETVLVLLGKLSGGADDLFDQRC